MDRDGDRPFVGDAPDKGEADHSGRRQARSEKEVAQEHYSQLTGERIKSGSKDPSTNISNGKLQNGTDNSMHLSAGMSGMSAKNQVTKSLLQTSVIKDLRQQKERAKQRKSMLIYGTKDIKRKLWLREETKNKKKNRSSVGSGRSVTRSGSNGQQGSDDVKQRKSCKDFMKWSAKSPSLNFWDGVMLVIIVYSCFSSMYFAAIEFDICNDWIFHIENICTAFFTLDIIFRFFRLPENKDASQVTHAQIATKYIASGSFFFELIATIPLYLISRYQNDPCQLDQDGSQTTVIIKLVRLVRIKRIFTLLEMNRINSLVATLFSNQTRSKKVVFSLIMKNIYSVFRLILLTVIITYFIGCLFYLVSGLFDSEDPNFISYYELKQTPGYYQMITSCYFSITTLSTVGYGDLSPKSRHEMIFGIFIMLAGVAFFSYIMGSFIEIISTFNQNLGNEEQTFDLHNWMTLLTRFREKPLPNSLYRQINQHFKYFWANNRLSQVQKDNEFINALPRQIKRGIIVHYLFDDIFYNFRFFFNPQKNKDSKFLYDVAFGLKPRHFSEKEDENVIYDEEEEVLEMYFILSGTVGIGYHTYQQPLERKPFNITHQIGSNSFFGDYYLCSNTKAEFVHIALVDVEAFALSKKFLMGKVFPKYPLIYRDIKNESRHRYQSTIKDEIMRHKFSHIEVVNKRSTYNNIQLKPKEVSDIQTQQVLVAKSKSDSGTTNIRQQFQERIVGIEQEMKKIEASLTDFLGTVQYDFMGLIGKINQMRDNMTRLIDDRKKTESIRNEEQIKQNAKRDMKLNAANAGGDQNIQLQAQNSVNKNQGAAQRNE